MFKNLTDQEIVALFSTIKRGRDALWASARHISQDAYNTVYDLSETLNLLHLENTTR